MLLWLLFYNDIKILKKLSKIRYGGISKMTEIKNVYQNENRLVQDRVEDLLSRMTLEQKLAQLQCSFVGLPGKRKKEKKSWKSLFRIL
jgi:hypothetical protein